MLPNAKRVSASERVVGRQVFIFEYFAYKFFENNILR
jgi:hypothetical protein